MVKKRIKTGICMLISALYFLNVISAQAMPGPLTQSAAAPPQETVFTDVEPGNRNYVPIRFLKETKACVEGYEDGAFHPYDTINRAEAVAMIMRCTGEQTATDPPTGENPFSDAAEDQWYWNLVTTAHKSGIVRGYPDNTFRPGNEVSLAEALAMTVRALGLEDQLPQLIEKQPAADVPLERWYTPYAALAMDRYALFQNTKGEINATDPLLRGQLANMLYRMLDFDPDVAQYGNASYYGGRFNGQTAASGSTFSKTAATAAHRTYPFGTLVRVTNLYNGKTVEVTINDRGPYVPGRIIDLSRFAFEVIEHPGRGVIQAKVEILETQ